MKALFFFRFDSDLRYCFIKVFFSEISAEIFTDERISGICFRIILCDGGG